MAGIGVFNFTLLNFVGFRKKVMTGTQKKTLVAFLVCILLLITTSIFYSNSIASFSKIEERVNRHGKLISLLDGIMLSLREKEAARRGYAISNNDLFLNEYKDVDGRLNKILSGLKQFASTDSSRTQMLTELMRLSFEKIDIMDKQIEVQHRKKYTSLDERKTTDQSKSVMDRIEYLINDIKRSEIKLLETSKQSAVDQNNLTSIVLIASLFIQVIVLLSIYFVFSNDINNRIAKEQNLKTEQVALQKVIENKSDEIKSIDTVLQESRQRHSFILDNLIEGCQILSFNWVYLYINNAAAQQGKKSVDELLGKDIREAYPQIVETPFFQLISECMNSRKPATYENNFGFDDGSAGWFQLSIQPVPEGVFILSLDISERKKAEHEIKQLNKNLEIRVQERTEQLEDLYQNAPAGYFSCDKTGTISKINNTVLRWIGYERREIEIVKSFYEILSDSSREHFNQTLTNLNDRKEITGLEMDIMRKDGSILSVHINARVFVTAQGEFQHISWTLFDITEKKRIELELKKANQQLKMDEEELRAVNKELESFSYSVSHDLRAPIRHILGFMELLTRHAEKTLDTKARRYITVISDSAKKMSALIDDLLQYSRTGRVKLNLTNLDATSFLMAAISQFKLEKANKNVKWDIDLSGEVVADEGLLRFVVQNLVENAIKFSSKREFPLIKIRSYCSEDSFIFNIEDNGAGFDENYSQKLFGVFQRLHTDEDFAGTGIGLANVKKIIGLHGGTISGRGKVNVGAKFEFTIPLMIELT